MCAGAMKSGAAGVTFGRKIFQHKNPCAIIHALHQVIIEGKDTKEALIHLARS